MAEKQIISSVNPSNLQSWAGVVKEIIRNHDLGFECCIPALVKKVYPNGRIVDLEPLVKMAFKTEGGVIYKDRSVVYSIPVRRLISGGFLITLPIREGDTGWLFASDRDATLAVKYNSKINVEENPGTQPPASFTLHEFASGFFIPDNWSDISPSDGITIAKYDDSGNILNNIVVKDDSIAIFSSGEVNITGSVKVKGTLEVSDKITASAGMTSKAGITVSGDISSTGNVSASNNITSNGDITAAGTVKATTIVAENIPTTRAARAVAKRVTIKDGGIVCTDDISTANLTSTGDISADGNVTATNLVSNGNISFTGDISTSGTITAGSLASTGGITAGGDISAQGSITGNPIVISGGISLEGDISTQGTITAGKVTSGSIESTGSISAASITATGDISAANVTASNKVQGKTVTSTSSISAASITASGAISGNSISSKSSVSAASITTTGNITSSGTVRGKSVTSDSTLSANSITSKTTIKATGNVSSDADVITGSVSLRNHTHKYTDDNGSAVNIKATGTATGSTPSIISVTGGTVTATRSGYTSYTTTVSCSRSTVEPDTTVTFVSSPETVNTQHKWQYKTNIDGVVSGWIQVTYSGHSLSLNLTVPDSCKSSYRVAITPIPTDGHTYTVTW